MVQSNFYINKQRFYLYIGLEENKTYILAKKFCLFLF